MTENNDQVHNQMPERHPPTEEQPDADAMARAKELAEKLTPRQLALVKGVFEGKNQSEAARLAGYPAHTARQAASRDMRRPEIRELIRAVYEANGMTVEDLARKNLELLDAKQFGLSREGFSVELGPDAHAQAKALDLAYKVNDFYPNWKLDVDHQVRGAVVVLRESDILGPDLFAVDAIEGEAVDVVPQDYDEQADGEDTAIG